MSALDDLDLSGYAPESIDAVKTWAEFIVDVIEVDPKTNGSRLKIALEPLAQKAQSLYPDYLDHTKIELRFSDIADKWTLPDEVGEIFVGLTGHVLFLGEDGPLATAAVLHDAIGTMTTHVQEAANA